VIKRSKIANVANERLGFCLDFNNVLENIKSGEALRTKDDSELSLASLALVKLLLDARSMKLAEKDFLTQLKTQTEFKDDRIELLGKLLSEANILDELITSDEYRFRDLEWRLEAKVNNLETSNLNRFNNFRFLARLHHDTCTLNQPIRKLL
jgi:hypothetical protein